MTCELKTHLSLLEQAARDFPSRPVFKVPQVVPGNEEVEEWEVVTYSQFDIGVKAYAKHWSRTLAADGIPQRSIVGLWLGGLTYLDVLHIYGIARAGYIPQLFSIRLPSPEVIFELLVQAGARALVYDPCFRPHIDGASVKTYLVTEINEAALQDSPLPLLPKTMATEDTAMIFHTSGSTSGTPKLVRCSYKWLDSMISKAGHVSKPKDCTRQDVTVWMGSMAHIGQTFMLLGTLQHGSCVIQPTKIAFPSGELLDMVGRCGLNRLNQFATFLAGHLRSSRRDPKLLQVLAGLDEVLYSGLALPREEEEWAYAQGVPIKNLFGSTECGAMMLSVGGVGEDAGFLQPIASTNYGFFPVSPSDSQSAQPHQNANQRLLELVILSDSNDCPDPSLRAPDGHFHTGDLFVEVAPGSYVSRGRDDDWIKSENSLRCDTKAIEDNVRATCGELVAECVVVGNGRPSPALFVEPKVDTDEERLKQEIVRKTRHFHSRRYLHERITSTKFVFVVPSNTLPRTSTKGNIRRRAVEEGYKDMLDRAYGMSF